MIRRIGIDIPTNEIAGFCGRWKISELSLFGSVLNDAFGPDSDVDILVDFSADAEWDLLDADRMQAELVKILHRPVDLVTRRSVESSENWIRRQSILQSAEPIYVVG